MPCRKPSCGRRTRRSRGRSGERNVSSRFRTFPPARLKAQHRAESYTRQTDKPSKFRNKHPRQLWGTFDPSAHAPVDPLQLGRTLREVFARRTRPRPVIGHRYHLGASVYSSRPLKLYLLPCLGLPSASRAIDSTHGFRCCLCSLWRVTIGVRWPSLYVTVARKWACGHLRPLRSLDASHAACQKDCLQSCDHVYHFGRSNTAHEVRFIDAGVDSSRRCRIYMPCGAAAMAIGYIESSSREACKGFADSGSLVVEYCLVVAEIMKVTQTVRAYMCESKVVVYIDCLILINSYSRTQARFVQDCVTPKYMVNTSSVDGFSPCLIACRMSPFVEQHSRVPTRVCKSIKR